MGTAIVVETNQQVTIDGETYTVKESCKGKGGSWYCATHNKGFQNQLMKDIHIGNTGKHRLLWLCPEHGPETP